ncbi:hypothetical protein LCGC14_1736020 [marine sediment metagenome]|uniref:Uncharacterized protein n=1 Tax=marine sediment metagenome TaxID=412755 RepID=A0A0F9HVR2_9ZZZZ
MKVLAWMFLGAIPISMGVFFSLEVGVWWAGPVLLGGSTLFVIVLIWAIRTVVE